MAKAKPGIRVTIQLDPRVALESVLLNRHRQLPVNRRQEWLRGLLVQGFRSETEASRLCLIHISEPTRLLSISYAVFCLTPQKPTGILHPARDQGPHTWHHPPTAPDY